MTHLKQRKSFVSSSPPLGHGCNRGRRLHPWPDRWLEETKWFFCFRCHWTNGLFTVIKLQKFFVLIFAVFLPNFVCLYHGGTDSPKFQKKMCSCPVSTPHNSTTFTVPLAGNGHYQGNGVAVDVLVLMTPLHHTNFVATVLHIKVLSAPKKPRTWLRIWCVTGVTWQSFSCKQFTSYVTFYHPNFFEISSRVCPPDATNGLTAVFSMCGC